MPTRCAGASEPVVAFSPPMAEANQVIKEFLFARMYRHWRREPHDAQGAGC